MSKFVPTKSDMTILMNTGIQFHDVHGSKWWLKYQTFHQLLLYTVTNANNFKPIQLVDIQHTTDEQWNYAWLNQVPQYHLDAVAHMLMLLREYELKHVIKSFYHRYPFIFIVIHNPLTIVVKEDCTDLDICRLIQELPNLQFELKIYSKQDFQFYSLYDMGELVSIQ